MALLITLNSLFFFEYSTIDQISYPVFLTLMILNGLTFLVVSLLLLFRFSSSSKLFGFLDWFFDPNVSSRFVLVYFFLLIFIASFFVFGGVYSQIYSTSFEDIYSLAFVIFVLYGNFETLIFYFRLLLTSFKLTFYLSMRLLALLSGALLACYIGFLSVGKIAIISFTSDLISYATVMIAGSIGCYFAEVFFC